MVIMEFSLFFIRFGVFESFFILDFFGGVKDV